MVAVDQNALAGKEDLEARAMELEYFNHFFEA